MFSSKSGIILKKIPYSEADEIITVLLKDEGVRRFFVRGSRKSKKRYPGFIDHFAHLIFSFKESTRGLAALIDVQQFEAARQASLSLKDFAFLSYLAELIVEFIHEGDGDHGLYVFWLDLVRQFGGSPDHSALALKTLGRFFSLVGYAPASVRAEQPVSKRRVVELTEYSERLLQKKSRAADFFLKTLQESENI